MTKERQKKTINLAAVPRKPGVYFFRDAKNILLYIGKAKDLKNRVSSYFHHSAQLSGSKQIMVSRITKVEYIITRNEVEALLLESNLIKQHQPPYNIDLKDDKNFLYIKITLAEEFPRVFTVRSFRSDGSRYFGPFVSAHAARETLRTLQQLFPHRNFAKPPSAYQLEFLIKRYPELLGPNDPTEYRQTITRIITFLKGDYEDVLAELRRRMRHAAQRRNFERAATFRDKIQSIEHIMERQVVVSTRREDFDIISLARQGGRAAVNVFSVKRGKLLSKQAFSLARAQDQSDAELVQTFIERFYSQAPVKPAHLLVPVTLPDPQLIERTFDCRVTVPQRGAKRQYLKLGEENAQQYLEQQKASWEKDERATREALLQFQQILNLPAPPQRIEVYDISNIQGYQAVGSMITFIGGKPDKRWYRKFRIKTVEGANDPAMMAEVLKRRFARSQLPTEQQWPLPDLIILDGGKGQLNVVRSAVAIPTPIVALAKQHEDIYLPDQPQPVRFPDRSPALFLIERMRDEAHRFAITFYRERHRRALRHSLLDEVPGLGPDAKKKLLGHFGTVRKIRQANQAELTAIVGDELARCIHELL